MLSKIQNFLIPSFLKRLDFWLMTYKPHIWRTKGHFVVFYCLIAAILLYVGGKMYPQNFADFYDNDDRKSTDLVLYFTAFLAFTSVGIVMWWWHSIQKFAYRRTNIVHFLTEIGIYTLGIFSISLFVFSFQKGFSYRQAYQLEKNSREDSVWVVENNFFQYGYMPHFQANKENDFKNYFKDGEILTQKMSDRQNVVFNILSAERRFANPTLESLSDYSPRESSSHEAFSLSYWEYPSNEKRYPRPPQYKMPSDYMNRILSNGTFRNQEEKRWKFKEDDNTLREFLTNMTADEIGNLIDEVYPKYFHRINYVSENQSIARELLKMSINKKLFLESLSDQEVKDYTAYLMWLKGNFALYAPQPIVVFEQNAGHAFHQKRNSGMDGNLTEKEKAIYFDENIDIKCDNYFDEDRGALAGEKFLHFVEKLDSQSTKTYLHYLKNETYNDVIKGNKKNPLYAPNCKKYFAQYTPKSNLDSLYHYDYYATNSITEYTWMYIISDEYSQYVTNKYSEKDYDRLRNMLHINGFEDVYPQAKDKTLQKLLQLHQVEDYKNAILGMHRSRRDYASIQQLTFSFFTLTFCLLLAIIFYIATLSTGVQFWISAFVTGFVGALLLFLIQAIPRASRSLSRNLGDAPDRLGVDNFIMFLYGFLFLILIVLFLLKKVQISKAAIWFNAIMFSGLLGVLFTVVYVQERVEIKMRSDNNVYSSMSSDEKLRITTFVLLGAAMLYAFLTWLYKRHLTYPKKK